MTTLEPLEVTIRNEVKLIMRERKRRQVDLLDIIKNFFDEKLMEIPDVILNKPLSSLTTEEIQLIKNRDDHPGTSNTLGKCHLAGVHNYETPQTKAKKKYQSPAKQKSCYTRSMVTPKFNPHAPMSVLRIPREGEVAMSMTGSPLRVAAVINESKPNVLVPLNDGRVLSVLPERGIRMSQIPDINENLRYQLEILHENIQTLLSKTTET